jgi:hypothetical protein
MNSQLAIAIAVAVTAVLAALGMALANYRRDKRQAEREDDVAKAAQEYLSRFEIRARIVAVTLPGDRMVLMVETPPHKKLRFSYIIEQPIKQFVLKQTQIEVDRMFWRFPMPAKGAEVPAVQYGCPTTQVMPTPQAPQPAAAPSAEPATASAATDEEDEYFLRHSYQIEEVSWEDFSTVSKPEGLGKSSGK